MNTFVRRQFKREDEKEHGKNSVFSKNIKKRKLWTLTDTIRNYMFKNLKETSDRDRNLHLMDDNTIKNTMTELIVGGNKTSLLDVLEFLDKKIFNETLDNLRFHYYNLYVRKIEESCSEENNWKKCRKKRNYKGGYEYIPTPPWKIRNMAYDLINQGKLQEKSFLDIGCWVPLIPQIMKDIGCKKVAGLEYNQVLVEKSKQDFRDIKIHCGNMLTFTGYEQYDILYAYNPLRDDNLMIEALYHIIKNMKVGASFYFYNARLKREDLKKIWFKRVNFSNMFKYTKSTSETLEKKVIPVDEVTTVRKQNLSEDEFEELFNVSDCSIREEAAERTDLPEDVVRKLSNDPEFSVCEVIAKRADLPEDVVRNLSNDPYFPVRKAITERIDLPEDVVRNLSKDPNWVIREAIAKRTNLPKDVVEKLSDDPIPSVRETIAENGNIFKKTA